MMDHMIELKDVDLLVRHSESFDLKKTVLNFFDFSKNKVASRYVTLADSLNFTFKEGDRVGILGRNGAGKSTLLKIICGIYPPDKGRVTVEGSIFPLIELGAGFHPDLTGEENVYLYGGLCGISKKEIRKIINDIFDFSELQDFRYDYIKTYSSGMYARLAFTVATSFQYDILLLDEVFATGDVGFLMKAKERMKKKIDESKIVVMVSHDSSILRDYCNRFIWLDKGKLVADRRDSKVIDEYLNSIA